MVPTFTTLLPDGRAVPAGGTALAVAGREAAVLVRPGPLGWPVLPGAQRTPVLTLVLQGDGDLRGATLGGQALQVLTVPVLASGQAVHPLGGGLAAAAPGSRLVAVRLPYGLTGAGPHPDVALQFSVGAQPLQVSLSAAGGAASALTLASTAARARAALSAPEAEAVPGAMQELTVTAEAAPGVPGLLLQASLPPGAAFDSATLAGGTGEVSFDEATGLVTGVFSSVGEAPRMVVRFFALGAGRLEGVSRAAVAGPNQAGAFSPDGPGWLLDAKPVALQSAVAALGAPAHGGALQWTLTADVSPAGASNLVITDTLGNGQRFDPTVAPVLTILRGGVPAYSGAITPSVATRADGTTSLVFDVSGAETGVWSLAGTTVQVVFQSVISTLYGGPQVAQLVGQGDVLANSATLRATVGGVAVSDGTTASLTLPSSSVQVSVHAINGQLAAPGARAAVGDAVTYRVQAALPLSTARGFSLLASTPGPMGSVSFEAGASGAGGGIPALGRARFGPNGSYTALTPAITANADGTLRFDFGSVLPVQGLGPGTLDLLYTTRLASSDPGPAEAQVWLTERNLAGATRTGFASATVAVEQPVLRLQTASLYASNDAATWTGTGGPWGWSEFTGQFGGVVSSAGLLSSPFSDVLYNVDAGDEVVFVIAVESTTAGPAHGVVLRNLVPTGFVLPPGGADIWVTDGRGRRLAFTGDLFDPAGGLALAAPMPGYDANSGANIVLVTFLLRTAAAMAVPGQTQSVAQIVSYAAEPGGANFQPAQPGLASASTGVVALRPTVAITMRGTDAVLAPTETATFDITVTLPEGLVDALTLDTLLPAGMRFLSATVEAGANISFAAPPVQTGGRISFGAVTNLADNRLTDADRIVVRAVAQAGTGLMAPSPAEAVLGGAGGWTARDYTPVSVSGPSLAAASTAPAVMQPGEVRSFTAQVANAAGAGDAYNVRLTATLPKGLTLVAGSVSVAGAPAALGAGLTATAARLDAGEVLTLSYQARMAPSVTNKALLGSTAAATADVPSGSGLLPGALAVQTETSTRASTASLFVSGPATVRVGVTASILARVVLPDSASPSVTLRTVLPAGVQAVPGSARIISTGAGLAGVSTPAMQVVGGQATMTFGAVPAGTGDRSMVVLLQTSIGSTAAVGKLALGLSLQTGLGGVVYSAVPTLANTPPTLSPLPALQATPDTAPLQVFAGIAVQDVNAAQVQTIRITLSNPANGTLSGPGLALVDGAYRITSTAAVAGAALAGLRFIPAPGRTAQTVLTMTVADGAGGQASASTTIVASSPGIPAMAGSPAMADMAFVQAAAAQVAAAPFVMDADAGTGQPWAAAALVGNLPGGMALATQALGVLDAMGLALQPSAYPF